MNAGTFPILWQGSPTYRAALEAHGCPREVPLALMLEHELQARSNHGGQGIEALRERGGLDPREALAVLTWRPWQDYQGAELSDVVAKLKIEVERWTEAVSLGGIVARAAGAQREPSPTCGVAFWMTGVEGPDGRTKLAGAAPTAMVLRGVQINVVGRGWLPLVSARVVAARVGQRSAIVCSGTCFGGFRGVPLSFASDLLSGVRMMPDSELEIALSAVPSDTAMEGRRIEAFVWGSTP